MATSELCLVLLAAIFKNNELIIKEKKFSCSKSETMEPVFFLEREKYEAERRKLVRKHKGHFSVDILKQKSGRKEF